VLCDLDGVIWLSHQPIDGSPEAIARLRAAGHRVLFVTNNSSAKVAEQEAALASVGIPADGDVLTSRSWDP
jgi:ribonucleotide monophosphatase NagD (HAD superfamily)